MITRVEKVKENGSFNNLSANNIFYWGIDGGSRTAIYKSHIDKKNKNNTNFKVMTTTTVEASGEG